MISSPFNNTPLKSQWESIGIKSHHGINTPLFSLRSSNSSGIGEFLDLKLVIDWLKPLNFDVIQLLPLYASGLDASPYNALSANALNPIYISLSALEDIQAEKDLYTRIQTLKSFNFLERVAYPEIKREKEKILLSYTLRRREDFLKNPDYIHFLQDNQWLQNYAEFKTLKIYFGWKNFSLWPKLPNLSEFQNEIDCHKIIQFLAYQQMESVKAYATEKKMLLMGDIPILVSQDSADVWKNPELFDLTLAAGAPPDMYNQEGQNWGFPLYNYEALEKDNHAFWKNRLKSASRLFHMYRIDHIIGFFRIWAIAKEQKAASGFFVPKEESLWLPQGEKMLDLLINNSPMLPIGEDLGVVLKETRDTMRKKGISGTKVMYWERNWNTDRSFIPLDQYPQDSLTTVSTHDSEPLPLWWHKHPDEAKDLAHFMKREYQPTLGKDQLFDILRASHQSSSLFHINLLQEYLSLFPDLTWKKQEEERINLPGVVSPLNWTYRYKPTIEEMANHPELSQNLKNLIS